jgi:hypothetical protein
MKKNLLLTVLFVLGITLPIQMQAQEKEKGFFVEGSIALVDEHAKNDYENFLIIKPTIGYSINPKWDLGLRMEIQSGAEDVHTVYGTFVRYSFCNFGKIRFFGEGKFNIFARKKQGIGEGVNNGYTEAGFSLGAYLPLNNNFKLVAQYLHIGYSGQETKNGAFLHNGDWGIDANLKRLSIGINYTF